MSLPAFHSVNAQPQTAVYINSSGDCEFYYDVTIDGTLGCHSYLGGYLLMGIDYGPRFYPYANNSGSVGTNSNAFASFIGYNFYNLSDKRQKENIRNIDNALNLIKQLNGVKYDIKKEFSYIDSLNDDEKYIQKQEKERKNKIGFLAQDVNEVLPEVVHYDDSSDIFTIDYTKIIPVLVEAIKELSAELDDLKETKNLKSANIDQTSNVLNETATLSQNIPNPFNTSTRIEMFIPTSVQKAVLCIYNLQGEQIDQIPVPERNNTAVTIEAYRFKAGMYLYSLIADGNLVDTKKMVLTQQ